MVRLVCVRIITTTVIFIWMSFWIKTHIETELVCVSLCFNKRYYFVTLCSYHPGYIYAHITKLFFKQNMMEMANWDYLLVVGFTFKGEIFWCASILLFVYFPLLLCCILLGLERGSRREYDWGLCAFYPDSKTDFKED